MSVNILPIVEGKSEVESVPVLLRRLLHQFEAYEVSIAHPFLIKRYKFVKEGELERSVKVALRVRKEISAVVVLLDADDDPPEALANDLAERVQRCSQLPFFVSIAAREIEAWFLGAKESLRAVRNIRNDAVSPSDPESIRDAKGYLSRNMAGSYRYISVDDQPALAAEFDISAARRKCTSFELFCSQLKDLLCTISRR